MFTKRMSRTVVATSNFQSIQSRGDAMQDKDTFIVYRSFYEATKPLSDQEKLALYEAIFEYGLNHQETKLEPLPQAMFSLMKPILEANHTRWLNGNKGGKPKSTNEKTIIDEVLELGKISQTELTQLLNPPVSKSILSKWKNNQENIPPQRVREFEALLFRLKNQGNFNRKETEPEPNKDKDKDVNKDIKEKGKKERIENFEPNQASLAVMDEMGFSLSQLPSMIQSFRDQMINRSKPFKDIQSCWRNYLRKGYVKPIEDVRTQSFGGIRKTVTDQQSSIAIGMSNDEIKQMLIEQQVEKCTLN